MTNVIIDRWNKMYNLLSQHKFTIISVINDNYKCRICNHILINAHQAICGCHFCYECINQYMSNGAINCPNNTEECKLESLSNIAPNHIMNKLISNLIVQCPYKMCSHECQLIEMENHLNSCLKKGIKCPFNDVGCEQDYMSNDKLNEHMVSDIQNHNKILIDFIGNLRNEMQELKENMKENRLEIEILKANDRRKDEIIESLKEEIQSIKQENEDLTQQMEIGDRNLWYKFDEIDIEINMKCTKHEILKEFDEKFDMEMNVRYSGMNQEWNDKLDEKIEKMKEENVKSDSERLDKIYKIDKYLKMTDDGTTEWEIGKINEIKFMWSDYFYNKQNPYKMYLQLDNISNELNIYLIIRSSVFDDDLKWPCDVDITINIFASNDLNILKCVKKSCKIDKPENDSYKLSDSLKISHSELTKSNLIKLNCLLCCEVKFK